MISIYMFVLLYLQICTIYIHDKIYIACLEESFTNIIVCRTEINSQRETQIPKCFIDIHYYIDNCASQHFKCCCLLASNTCVIPLSQLNKKAILLLQFFNGTKNFVMICSFCTSKIVFCLSFTGVLVKVFWASLKNVIPLSLPAHLLAFC